MTTPSGRPISRFGRFGSLALAALPLVPAGKTAAQDVPVPAAATARSDFAIPAGNLAAALEQFTRQTGLRVAVGDARIAELQTRGARGSLTTTEALAQLLGGTGYERIEVRSGRRADSRYASASTRAR